MSEAQTAIDPRHTALLVMDYQHGILDSLDGAPDLLDRTAQAIAIVRRHGGQIGFVRVAFDDADFEAIPTTSMMAAAVAVRGRALHTDDPATAIHEQVAPEEGDIVVRKTRVGAFSTTDLDEQLRARHVDTLILAGLSTSGVVLSTLRDACDRDYRIVVLADACADPHPGVHEFLVERIFSRHARIASVDDLVALLVDG